MREYARVAPQFWTGDTGKQLRKLGAEAQVLAGYLMTGPAANMIGLYYVSIPSIAHDTGLSVKRITDLMAHLATIGFALYDFRTEYVFVPRMARFQIGISLAPRDKRLRGIVTELCSVPCRSFVDAFIREYREAFCLDDDERVIRHLSKPLLADRKPLPDVEKGHPSAQAQAQAQEQAQAQAQTEVLAADPAALVPPLAELEAPYPAGLVAEARQACALSRKNGRMADSVWHRTLVALSTHPPGDVVEAMRTFVEKHADGDKSEAYLLGIARRRKQETRRQRGDHLSAPAAPHAAFADGQSFAFGSPELGRKS